MAFPQTIRRSLLVWRVHGSWMDSFVAGGHRYLIPANAPHDRDGRGLCGRDWMRASEVPLGELHHQDIDLLITAKDPRACAKAVKAIAGSATSNM